MRDAERYRRAFGALSTYYDHVVSQAADAVLAKEETLGNTFFGHGEEIIDRYGHVLLMAGQLLGGLQRALDAEEGGGPRPRTDVAVLRVAEDELQSELSEWFRHRPEIRLQSMQVIPGEEQWSCVVVYDRPGGDSLDQDG